MDKSTQDQPENRKPGFPEGFLERVKGQREALAAGQEPQEEPKTKNSLDVAQEIVAFVRERAQKEGVHGLDALWLALQVYCGPGEFTKRMRPYLDLFWFPPKV